MTKLDDFFEKYLLTLKELGDPEDDIVCDAGEKYVRLYAYYVLGEKDPEKIEESIVEVSSEPHSIGVFENEYDDCIEFLVPVQNTLLSIGLPQIYTKLKNAIRDAFSGKGWLAPLKDVFEDFQVFQDAQENGKNPSFHIILLAETEECDSQKKNAMLQSLTALANKKNCKIFFPSELLDRIEELTAGPYVEEGIISVEHGNKLFYGEEKSLVVNLWASSLQNIYRKYKNKGLFEQNLRYQIPGKNVDAAILESAEQAKSDFWYFNNGINIVCENYSFISQSEIKLEKFSIINGCQTTNVIGKKLSPINPEDKEKDFLILCKIIRTNFSNKEDFVSALAAAANQQKPIKESDLIANKLNQRVLKKQLEAARIFYELKRGQKLPQKLSDIEKWAKTKSVELGTLIFSALAQKPGPARTSKSSIFGKKNSIAIWGEDNLKTTKYHINFYRDLLLIKFFFENWRNLRFWEEEESEKKNNSERDGLLKNGLCEMVATLVAFAKCTIGDNAHLIETSPPFSIIKDDINIENLEKLDDFSEGIFSRPVESFRDREQVQREAFLVFDRLMNHCVLPAFKEAKLENPTLAPSNFLKAPKYHVSVLKKLLHSIDGELAGLDAFFSKGIVVAPSSPEERARVGLLQLRFKKLKSRKEGNKARKLIFSNKQAENVANAGKAIVSKLGAFQVLEKLLLEKFDFSPAQCDFWGKEFLKVLRKNFR